MKIATQHYQDSVITPYGNNHWNGKEKIDISKETLLSQPSLLCFRGITFW